MCNPRSCSCSWAYAALILGVAAIAAPWYLLHQDAKTFDCAVTYLYGWEKQYCRMSGSGCLLDYCGLTKSNWRDNATAGDAAKIADNTVGMYGVGLFLVLAATLLLTPMVCCRNRHKRSMLTTAMVLLPLSALFQIAAIAYYAAEWPDEFWDKNKGSCGGTTKCGNMFGSEEFTTAKVSWAGVGWCIAFLVLLSTLIALGTAACARSRDAQPDQVQMHSVPSSQTFPQSSKQTYN